MGLFGAIGRETRGAMRSLSYDLRQSRRFRRIGVIAVATVAGGVLATGALLREPVPGLTGLGGDGEDSGIVDGWFGLGSDTTGQEAETSESASEAATGAPADPGASPTGEQTQVRGSGSGSPRGGSPELVPLGEETSGPSEEEDGTGSPSPSPEPGGETSGGPSGEPTGEPSSEPPTLEPSGEPTPGPTTPEPSPSASEPGDAQTSRAATTAPADPRKGPVRG